MKNFVVKTEKVLGQKDKTTVVKAHNADDAARKGKKRLAYLRRELRAERISYGELCELQGLAEFIEPGDVELLEAAMASFTNAVGKPVRKTRKSRKVSVLNRKRWYHCPQCFEQQQSTPNEVMDVGVPMCGECDREMVETSAKLHKILDNGGVELSDGGIIETPDDDGVIRRRDKDGNTVEVRGIGGLPDFSEAAYQEWHQMFE